MEKETNQRGITLIALIVTIIVLLILAAISLNLINGNEGIITKASNAADKTKISSVKENIELEESKLIAEYYEKKYSEDSDGLTTLGAYVADNIAGEISGYTIENNHENPYEIIVTGNGVELKGIIDEQTGKINLREKELSASEIAQNPQIYYGKQVTNYTAGGKTWRIFYVDNNNSFKDGENTIYLKADVSYTYKSLTQNTNGSMVINSPINETDALDRMKKMNPKWATKDGEADGENEKAALWLCDAETWKEYIDNNNSSYVNYAIGAPSLEMYVASYNQVPHEVNNHKLGAEYPTDSCGYVYQVDNEDVSASDNKTGNNSLDYSGYNSMYCGENGENNYRNWWICSPVKPYSSSIGVVKGHEADLEYTNYQGSYEICPIVSLKSSFKVQID